MEQCIRKNTRCGRLAIDPDFGHTAFVVSVVIHMDGQSLSTEHFFHGKPIPLCGNTGRDQKTFRCGPQAEDAFHTADHNGRGSTGQPVHVCTAGLWCFVPFNELRMHIGFHFTDFRAVVIGCRTAFLK